MCDQFHYRKSFKIIYESCCFHSLLELKFILSIEHEFKFLREHVLIFYDPKTHLPTNMITESTKKYTPDFLIRSTVDNRAYLVELKPGEFRRCKEQIERRRRVATNYISWKKLDWEFKIVYDDEIFLTKDQWKKFEGLRKKVGQSAGKLRMQERDRKYNSSQVNFFKTVPGGLNHNLGQEHIRFVKYGKAVQLITMMYLTD